MALGTIAFATFLVMLGFLWYQEGWRKGLKVLGLCFATFIVWAIALTLLKVDPHAGRYIATTLWALWAIGLIIYNIASGNIGRM